MKRMQTTTSIPPTTWLRTDQPVIPVNPATWDYLSEVENALRQGVTARADISHPGFYEIEIGERWFYVHVPSRLKGVYLVAVENRSTTKEPELLVHQHAC